MRDVVHATDPLAFSFSLGKTGYQHASEDDDDDEKFDGGKAGAVGRTRTRGTGWKQWNFMDFREMEVSRWSGFANDILKIIHPEPMDSAVKPGQLFPGKLKN
jgi:hypothetical protein